MFISMATTYRVFLDFRYKKKDDTYPLKIRVTINRKTKELPLDIFIEEKYWDKSGSKLKPTHPNYKIIQLTIFKKLAALQENSLHLENQGKVVTAHELTDNFRNKPQSVTFLSFAKKQVETMLKAGRVGNSIAYQCAINRIEKYIGKKELRFEEMDYRFLEDFTNSMIDEGLKPNGIACYMREIRAIYNKAIKMELVDAKYYPFLKYKIKTERTINRALTLDELNSLLDVEILEAGNMQFHRDLFLLSFCLIGINFADLLTLKHDHIINGRVVFHRKKTKKVYSIKLLPQTKKLISLIQNEQNSKGYLLPLIDSKKSLIQQKKDIGLIIHANNENMKKVAAIAGVDKPVSTYYARYSWANIAKSLGYSKDLIAEALGHEYGNKVTGIYLDNFDKELIDEMNERVIGKVLEKIK